MPALKRAACATPGEPSSIAGPGTGSSRSPSRSLRTRSKPTSCSGCWSPRSTGSSTEFAGRSTERACAGFARLSSIVEVPSTSTSSWGATGSRPSAGCSGWMSGTAWAAQSGSLASRCPRARERFSATAPYVAKGGDIDLSPILGQPVQRAMFLASPFRCARHRKRSTLTEHAGGRGRASHPVAERREADTSRCLTPRVCLGAGHKTPR